VGQEKRKAAFDVDRRAGIRQFVFTYQAAETGVQTIEPCGVPGHSAHSPCSVGYSRFTLSAHPSALSLCHLVISLGRRMVTPLCVLGVLVSRKEDINLLQIFELNV